MMVESVQACAGFQQRVYALMALGFSVDPPTRWMWPESDRYLEWFPCFADAYAGAAFEHDTVDALEHGHGYSMWLPPGVEPNDAAIESVIRESVPTVRFDEVMQLVEAMNAFHPREPVWFLPLIAVDPLWRRAGLGTELLRRRLTKCDRDGAAAYLDSTNPANLAFYGRHGFEVLGEINAGSCPPIHPMLRRPRQIESC